jgi:hypothetical protein
VWTVLLTLGLLKAQGINYKILKFTILGFRDTKLRNPTKKYTIEIPLWIL